MSQVLTIDQPKSSPKFQHPFLQELIKQIRHSDTGNRYVNWSDEFLINQLIIPSQQQRVKNKEFMVTSVNQLLTSAFYRAIGATIARKTGHPTDTFVHLRDKELGSAVICCGGVMVLSSLMWGYLSFGFLSLQQLIELAENNIGHAVTKASQYLDFVC